MVMKKILFTFAFLLVSIASSAYDAKIDGIYYNINPVERAAIVTKGEVNYQGDITIPSTIIYNGEDYTVTEITEEAFRDCISLTSIVIPHHVSIFRNSAFHSCINLTSIRLPDNLSRIPNSCFATCLKLSEIDLPDGIDAIGTDAFANCESLTHLTIPKSVQLIDGRAFAGSGITTVDIPSSVTKIGEGLFAGCKQLTSILSWPFTSVPRQTFKDCTGLVVLEISEGVKSIEDDAYAGCTNLQTVIIPKSVSYISSGSFKDCQNLKDVYIYCENIPNGSTNSIFEGSHIEYATLHVPASAIEAYRSNYPWGDFGTIVAIESTGINEALPQDKVQCSKFFAEQSGKAERKVQSESWYNLNGIRVAQPRKGVYIQNGKKVVIK